MTSNENVKVVKHYKEAKLKWQKTFLLCIRLSLNNPETWETKEQRPEKVGQR